MFVEFIKSLPLSPKIHIAYYKIPVYARAIRHNARRIPIRKLSQVMSKTKKVDQEVT